MSEHFGISGGGRSAEELFRQITGADPAERAAEGDALLPAGPALLVQEVISRPDEGSFSARSTLQENVIYTVFPPGCREALELTFATPVLHLGDVLVADAASVVDTLRITLAKVPR